MRKYLLISSALFIGLIYYLIGFQTYDNLNNTKIMFRSNATGLEYHSKGKWERFTINGINVEPVVPGTFPVEDMIETELYVKWFDQIQVLNINTIRVEKMMPGSFYKALYEYNHTADNPLFLLQGVYFDEVAMQDGADPLSSKWVRRFKDEIEATVNAVHGNPIQFANINIGQSNNVDVSEYVIGYTLGTSWGVGDVLFSEIMNESYSFDGNYFYSKDGANVFEVFITESFDHLMTYEMKKYGTQKLVTYIANGNQIYRNKLSQFVVQEVYDTIREKPELDIENIGLKENLKTGVFISYDYEELNKSARGLDLMKDLVEYHSVPLVISAYGVPSTRSANEYSRDGKSYIDEYEQGRINVEQYKQIRDGGVSGQFLRGWQDAWYKSSWNTKELVILDKSAYWFDPQTYGQGYGLLTFDPDHEKAFYPDGSTDEWHSDHLIGRYEWGEIYFNSDEQYLYYFIKKSNTSDLWDDRYYMALDISPRSGVYESTQFKMTFDRPIDFIIELDEQGQSEIFVHAYYDVTRFREDRKQLRRRPDVNAYTKNMDLFNSIYQYVSYEDYKYKEHDRPSDYLVNVGKLHVGNGNPDAQVFNSEADVYFGHGSIEVRIPYALLNFMDPSTKSIIGPFRGTYKIAPLDVDEIYVSVGKKSKETTVMEESIPIDWNDWVLPSYTQRLKKSYFMLLDEMSK